MIVGPKLTLGFNEGSTLIVGCDDGSLLVVGDLEPSTGGFALGEMEVCPEGLFDGFGLLRPVESVGCGVSVGLRLALGFEGSTLIVGCIDGF